MKQLYTTLVLFLLLSGIGGWIYFNERGPASQTGSTVLLRLDPQSVSSLVLQTYGGERLEFWKQNGEWQVRRGGVKMLGVPADAQATQSLLTALQLVQSGAVITDATAAELASYGLDQPRTSLVVGDAKIEFGGKPNFDVNKVYARVSGGNGRASQIALLPADLGNYTYKNLGDWRDKSILNFDVKKVTRISLMTPAGKAAFQINEDNQLDDSAAWKITSPVKSLAEAAMIGLFLQQLPQTKTAKFLVDAPSSEALWGLDKPIAKLELATDKGPRTLRVGKQVAGGYAAQNSASPAVFVLPSQLFGIMSRPLKDWRDKSVLKLNTGRLKTMRVQARGKQMQFTQFEGKWSREDGQHDEKYSTAVMEISFVLQKMAADNFIDQPQADSTYGLDKPVLSLTLTSEEWSGERTVLFGLKNGKTYARVLGHPDYSPMVLVLPAGALDGFKVSTNVLFGMSKKDSKTRPVHESESD